MFNKTGFIFFLFLQLHFMVSAQPSEKLTPIESFGSNPGNLKMFIYEPVQKIDTALKPLVVVLHGCGQNANDVSKLTGWNKLARLNNFFVLYPQQKISNNPNLCFNWFSYDDINKGKGECQSIFQMISYLCKYYTVDRTRIYITGLSAGAAMSMVMLAVHPDVFRCGAVFAGGAYKIATMPISSLKALAGNLKISDDTLIKNVSNQNPDYNGKYPSLIVYQGMNDPVVNHYNANLIIRQWCGIHHCDTVPEKIDSAFMNIPDITRKEFLDENGKSFLVFYEVKNLGHRLLIKPGKAFNEGGQTGIFGVNKGFHSTYQTALEFGLILNPPK